jgi:hypothetical protein
MAKPVRNVYVYKTRDGKVISLKYNPTIAVLDYIAACRNEKGTAVHNLSHHEVLAILKSVPGDENDRATGKAVRDKRLHALIDASDNKAATD